MRDRLGRWAAATVAVLALAASAIGIANGFTYDDRYIVELNPTGDDVRRVVAGVRAAVLAGQLGR